MSFDDDGPFGAGAAGGDLPAIGPGSVFAQRYRIDSVLGTGAMGRVYAAQEVHSGRAVALKVLHREHLGEEETVERFRREADVLASIGHPCIVEVLAFHRWEGAPYLAMELLRGETLKGRLQRGRFHDPREFQPIVDGICAALDAAHLAGVIHRDMKPDNIFLLAGAAVPVKLVDFGLSRIHSQAAITRAGMILGTPRYMAPEQIRSAVTADRRVDIFSVGVILFEALAGESIYPAEDYGQLLGCVIEGRHRQLDDSRPDLPRSLAEVVRRAVLEAPEGRYATAGALADAYAEAIGAPTQRHRFVAGRERKSGSGRPRSYSGPIASQGGTLAMDVSVARRRLEEELARDEQPSTESFASDFYEERTVREPAPRGAHAPASLPPPRRVGGSAPPTPSSRTVPGGVEAYRPATPAPSGPPAPAATFGPPVSRPPGPEVPQTMMLASGAPHPGPTAGSGPLPVTPMRHPAPGAPPGPTPTAPLPATSHRFSTPPPAPRRSGRGLWVALFLLAMVVVVVLSAGAGFALRAYLRQPASTTDGP